MSVEIKPGDAVQIDGRLFDVIRTEPHLVCEDDHGSRRVFQESQIQRVIARPKMGYSKAQTVSSHRDLKTVQRVLRQRREARA